MRIVSLLLILMLSLLASPQTAQKLGYQTDYQKAVAIAKKEQKPIMLLVVTSYCPWCRKFERKTLASETIATTVRSKFVPVIVDRNKDAENFPKKFQTPRIPTVFFVDPNDDMEFWETIGYVKKSEFADALKEAESLYKKRKK
ncbi:thioredoxin family protein [Sulfurimonas sp. HSL3-7]|uniref:thioredoxin family protein n=1 Tax=Sulfonitrofixus jiaomeiensis TaxID=3131938 RepID=UPI0031F9905E